MKILVTGANGYLGQGIVHELLNLGHNVIATDFTDSNIDNRANIICCNIFELKDPYNYLFQPEVVLHLAWRNGFSHNDDTHFIDLPYHNAFLKNVIDAGVKRVCVMGSMHEIGFFEGSIDENTACKPMSQYGIAKNALRQSIQIYSDSKNVDFIWLRGFYIIGNTLMGNSIFSKIAIAAKEGKKEFPFTMGKNQYDYIEYEEFCSQVALTVSQDKVLGIINICSGYPEKLSSRVEQFINENGYNIKLKYGAFPDRPYDSKAVWGNNTKINIIKNISSNGVKI